MRNQKRESLGVVVDARIRSIVADKDQIEKSHTVLRENRYPMMQMARYNESI